MGIEIAPQGIKLVVEHTKNSYGKEQMAYFANQLNVAEQTKSLGLSMAIVKVIVDAYNSKVEQFSETNNESILWSTLPTNLTDAATEALALEGATKEQAAKSIEEFRILVAEDIDSNFLLINAILKGFKLTRAINGKEAVEAASNQQFDLILMDIKMPIMDGVEATRLIREFNPTIPIIAVTANAFDEDKRRAFEAGMSEFISKPINKNTLQEAINKYR